MASLVTRKIPEVVLVGNSELGSMELFRLNRIYNTDRSEFVVCDHTRETIYVNKDLEYANDIVPIINKLMEQKHLDSMTCEIFNRFSNIAGKKAHDALLYIWQDWRKERNKADANEQAKKILDMVKKRRIRSRIKRKEDVIKAVFDIGFGTYREYDKCNFQKGIENAFVYGYLCALEANEKKQPAKSLTSAPPLIRE